MSAIIDAQTQIPYHYLYLSRESIKRIILNLKMANVGSHVFSSVTFLVFNLMSLNIAYQILDLTGGGCNKYSVLDVRKESCIILRLKDILNMI